MNTLVAQAAATTTASPEGWRARLSLGFRRDGDVTRLERRGAEGPLQVQRPFYPGDGACHVYVLHPPGGIVGGDRLDINVEAGAGTRALLTTPAAGKFYRSAGPVSQLRQSLQVRAGALLEWLPLETIVFSGAQARSLTRIDLDEDAGVIAWEIVCLGRPAAEERFDSGRFSQDMELYRQGRPVLLERNRYDGGGAVLDARWGLGGHPVAGLLIATPFDQGRIDAIRGMLPAAAAATLVDGVLVVRVLGDSGEQVRKLLIRIWQALRPRSSSVECPRIWNT